MFPEKFHISRIFSGTMFSGSLEVPRNPEMFPDLNVPRTFSFQGSRFLWIEGFVLSVLNS